MIKFVSIGTQVESLNPVFTKTPNIIWNLLIQKPKAEKHFQ